eukprot:9005469-Lingulodinium_polyedra.AAC.1
MRAEAVEAHRPRSNTRSMEPRSRVSRVAPPRRKLYGRKPQRAKPKALAPREKSSRNSAGFWPNSRSRRPRRGRPWGRRTRRSRARPCAA